MRILKVGDFVRVKKGKARAGEVGKIVAIEYVATFQEDFYKVTFFNSIGQGLYPHKALTLIL